MEFDIPNPEDKATQTAYSEYIFRNAPFIFDGQFIKSESYYNSKGIINTSTLVEVTFVFKGKLETGIVEIISESGFIMDAFDNIIARQFIRNKFSDRYVMGWMSSHSLPSIWLCKRSNLASHYQNDKPIAVLEFFHETVNEFRSDGRYEPVTAGSSKISVTVGANHTFESIDIFYKWLKKQGVKQNRKKTERPFYQIYKNRHRNKSLSGLSKRISLPTITYLSKRPLIAGLDTIHIVGSGFGNPSVLDRGKVIFRDASLGGSVNTQNIDPEYIQSWQDDRIVVVVPARINKGYPIGLVRPYGIAGSGVIKITNKLDTIIAQSSRKIYVKYALRTGRANEGFRRRYLANSNCKAGLQFWLHPAVDRKPWAKLMIQKALKEWSDTLGITLSLSAQRESNINHPTRNVIYMSNQPGVFAALPKTTTKKSGNSCTLNNDITYQANIEIDSTTTWSTVSNGGTIDANKGDFYRNILHEIGHIIGLDHSYDTINAPQNLMYYKDNATVVRNGIVMNSGMNTNKLAAKQLVTDSRLLTWCNDPNIGTLNAAMPDSVKKINTISKNRCSPRTQNAALNSNTFNIYPSTFAPEYRWETTDLLVGKDFELAPGTVGYQLAANLNFTVPVSHPDARFYRCIIGSKGCAIYSDTIKLHTLLSNNLIASKKYCSNINLIKIKYTPFFTTPTANLTTFPSAIVSTNVANEEYNFAPQATVPNYILNYTFDGCVLKDTILSSPCRGCQNIMKIKKVEKQICIVGAQNYSNNVEFDYDLNPCPNYPYFKVQIATINGGFNDLIGSSTTPFYKFVPFTIQNNQANGIYKMRVAFNQGLAAQWFSDTVLIEINHTTIGQTTCQFNNTGGDNPPILNKTTNTMGNEPKTLFTENDLTIFPNPTNAVLKIEWSEPIVNKSVILRLTDLQGRCLYEKTIDNVQFYEINMKDFDNGLYFLEIISETKQITRKILKIE